MRALSTAGLAAALVLALTAAGCGAAKHRLPVTSAAPAAKRAVDASPHTADPYRAALAFAACMRAHGVPHPDPDRTGDFHLTPAQERQLRKAGHAKVEAATKACFTYLRPVVSTKPLSAGAKARAVTVLEQLRRCVHEAGFELGAPIVKDVTQGRAMFGFQPGGSPPSSAMTKAEHTCERRVHLAQRISAIVDADRAAV